MIILPSLNVINKDKYCDAMGTGVISVICPVIVNIIFLCSNVFHVFRDVLNRLQFQLSHDTQSVFRVAMSAVEDVYHEI